MVDAATVTRYFQTKATTWIAAEGSVEAHVRRLGKEGLADEFRTDGDFGEVCQLVHELGELQARSHIVNSLEELIGAGFDAPIGGEMNIVIGAMALACGFTTLGEKLFWGGLATVAAAGLIGAVLASRRR